MKLIYTAVTLALMTTPAAADNSDVIKGIFGVIILNELLNDHRHSEHTKPRHPQTVCGTYTEVELTRYGRIYYTYDACTHRLIETRYQ